MVTNKSIEKYSKYLNKIIGSMKILSIDKDKLQKNRIYFNCECIKCHRLLQVRSDGLSPSSVGCSKCMGIWRKNNFEKKNTNLLPKDIRNKYIHFKCNAKRKNRNINFELTREQVQNLCESSCFYCGKNRCLGIDRKDNNKGYTNDNCVPCCGFCNRMKMDHSIDEFYLQIISIYNNLPKESSTTIPKGSTLQVNGNRSGEALSTKSKEYDIVYSA